MLDIIITFFVSVLLSFSFILIFSALFRKWKVLDNPKKYNKKRDPVPYGMWIIFIIVFFIVSFFFIEHNYKLYLLWFFGLAITTVSFIDDILNVSPKVRLLIQIIIWATIWITSIKIWYISNIFGWVINLETFHFEIFWQLIYIIPLIFTIIWYVFIFNAKLDRLNRVKYFMTLNYIFFDTFFSLNDFILWR